MTVHRLTAPPSSTQQKLHLKCPPSPCSSSTWPLNILLCVIDVFPILTKEQCSAYEKQRKQKTKCFNYFVIICLFQLTGKKSYMEKNNECMPGGMQNDLNSIHCVFLNYVSTLHKPNETPSMSMSSLPSPFWCNARVRKRHFYVSWHNFKAALCGEAIKEVSAGLVR